MYHGGMNKIELAFEKVAAADEHLRFVLNTAEGVLGVLGTTIRTASLASSVQPETRRAFDKVAKALDSAFGVTRDARSKASAAMNKRALGRIKKSP